MEIDMHKCDVAAYVWPAFTGAELRSRIFWPEGIGEWETVKNAEPKPCGYEWKRKPLWGYVNEADPYVMEMEIEAAVSHGVNVFIYDWYWYDNRPFLENCLRDGFLKARNRSKMTFYLMWANHDAMLLWDKRNNHLNNCVWSGQVNREQFEQIGQRWMREFFSQPIYYRIEGKPVFCIYDIQNFIAGLGGIGNANDALAWLDAEAERAGLGGVHVQLIKRSETSRINISGVDGTGVMEETKLLEQLRHDSLTHYQFVHFADMDREYEDIAVDVEKEWESAKRKWNCYFPHVSIGWDNNLRYTEFKTPVTKNNTPEAFEKLLSKARAFAENYNGGGLITINSWNEWTEGSYLEPDDLYGYGYLEAVKRVFVDKRQEEA